MNRALEIVILNSNGQLIYNSGLQYGERFKTKIDVSDWLAGTYIVKAKNRHQIYVQQFVKIE